MSYCTSCGKEMDAEWNVCPSCGTPKQTPTIIINTQTKRTVTISRDRSWYGLLRKLNIYIDGQLVGAVKAGENTKITLPASANILFGKMDWLKTNKLSLEYIEDGATIHATWTRSIIETFLSAFLLLWKLPIRLYLEHPSKE